VSGSLTYNTDNGYEDDEVTYTYGFYGDLALVNLALKYLEFQPTCPFTTGMTATILITAIS